MKLLEALQLDWDYWENCDDAVEMVKCRDVIIGDMIAIKRLQYQEVMGVAKTRSLMGPMEDIEKKAIQRVKELFEGVENEA